jgi:hypothetical protein
MSRTRIATTHRVVFFHLSIGNPLISGIKSIIADYINLAN